MHQLFFLARPWLRFNATRNGSRSFLYAVLAAVLFVSACGGQTEPVAQQQRRMPTGGQTETLPEAQTRDSGVPAQQQVGVVGSQQSLPYEIDIMPPQTHIFFDSNSAVLRRDAIENIARYVETLRSYPNFALFIEGHTDTREPEEYNLGCRRAMAVKEALVERGLAAGRLGTVSYGNRRPAVIGDGESAWAQNRRTVFYLETEWAGTVPLLQGCEEE